MSLVVRRATADDAAAIARLHADSWRTAYRGAMRDDYLDGGIDAERLAFWSARLRHSADASTLWVAIAERDREPLAFVCVVLDADPTLGALLDNLHVALASKGTGIGRRLMREAAAWIFEQRPASRMYLWVYEQNAPARGFYERLGGVVVGRGLRAAPDGSRVPALQYGWDDLPQLAGSTPASSAG